MLGHACLVWSCTFPFAGHVARPFESDECLSGMAIVWRAVPWGGDCAGVFRLLLRAGALFGGFLGMYGLMGSD